MYVFDVGFGMLLSYLPTGFNLFWIIPLGTEFFLEKLVVGTLIHLKFNLSILESLCTNIPLNIRMIGKANKI